MILSLQVKNFAIIDNVQIDFKKGMTTLVGQTGAGKSLIIDAIGLLFGDRASNDLVRYGETKASIEGVFCAYPQKVNEILKTNDIDIEELLVVKREIYENGKSIARINGEIVSLSTLSDISFYLGSIHSQFDTMKLVNPKNYFTFIDTNEIKELIIEYKKNLDEFYAKKKEYTELKNSLDEKERQLDYLKYQFDELKNANLSITEEEETLAKVKLLANHEKIFVNYQEFLELFDDNNLLAKIYEAKELLLKNKEYDNNLSSKIETLDAAYYDILDVYEDISSIVNHDDFDVQELDNLNDRLNVYSTLKRKYHLSTNELIDYYQKLESSLNKIENAPEYLEETYKQMTESFNKTLELAKNISILRQNKAKELEKELKDNLNQLQLKDTSLEIVISNAQVSLENSSGFLNNGIDTIDFLVSFNKGEKLKSLSKTASGGELSRFMLALKSISCDLVANSLFIFDEIDTGVSGDIAQSIGNRIKKIAKNNQVLCVTHLPQVASVADHQLQISKEVTNDGKTCTSITELDEIGRIGVIAKMLSTGEITNSAISLAEEMLSKNNN